MAMSVQRQCYWHGKLISGQIQMTNFGFWTCLGLICSRYWTVLSDSESTRKKNMRNFGPVFFAKCKFLPWYFFVNHTLTSLTLKSEMFNFTYCTLVCFFFFVVFSSEFNASGRGTRNRMKSVVSNSTTTHKWNQRRKQQQENSTKTQL